MNPLLRIVLPALVLALAGCDPLMYVKLDAPSIAVTQALPAVPGAPQVETTGSLVDISFDIGEIIVDQSLKDSQLTVNAAKLAITATTGTPAPTFAGIRSATLSARDQYGTPTVIASYDAAVDGPLADPAVLVLKPAPGVNLVPFLSDRYLRVDLAASGVPPGPTGTTWTSALTLDFHVVAQKNLP